MLATQHLRTTVLVLESQEVCSLVARAFLERHRLSVIEHADADAAMGVVKSPKRPDVLLMNLRCNGKETLALVKDIREFEAANQVPRLAIVVTSAVLGTDWEAQSLAAGADRVLPMPFDERQAVNAVWGAFWDVSLAHYKGDPLYELLRTWESDDGDEDLGPMLH